MTTSGETIRDLQDQVNRALLASDTRTLNDLVAPDARIIGLRGFLIGRDEWIGVHEGGDFRQERLEVGRFRRGERYPSRRRGVRVPVQGRTDHRSFPRDPVVGHA
jgi:hypothetical protein